MTHDTQLALALDHLDRIDHDLYLTVSFSGIRTDAKSVVLVAETVRVMDTAISRSHGMIHHQLIELRTRFVEELEIFFETSIVDYDEFMLIIDGFMDRLTHLYNNALLAA